MVVRIVGDRFRLGVLSSTLVLLALGALGGSPTALGFESQSAAYLAQPGAVLGIFCPEGDRTYLPKGEPDLEYDPIDWLVGGGPECLPMDLLYPEEPAGFGGVAVVADFYAPSVGVQVEITDDRFENVPTYNNFAKDDWGSSAWEHQCGDFQAVIEPYYCPWQSYGACGFTAYHWILIDSTTLSPDTNELCLASTGSVTVSPL